MAHTTSKTITPNQLEAAFNNDNLIQYLNSRMTAQELGRFFPPNVLKELDLNILNRQAVAYNAYLDDHGSDNDDDNNGSDPEFSATIYKQFTDNDIATTERTTVSSGLFSGGATSLSEFFYSPTLGDVSASYIPVYDKATSDSTAQVQFAVGYANYGGSGSIGNTTKTTAGNRETAALYRQFRNVILGQGTEKFSFTLGISIEW